MRLLAGLVTLLAMLMPASGTAGEEAVVSLGRTLTKSFQDREADRLWARMTRPMQDALGSPQALVALADAMRSQYGMEHRVLSERAETVSGFRVYLRTADHAGSDTPLITQFTFDAEDRIAGFFVRAAQEPAHSRFLEYQTRAKLRLPFAGAWQVVWGGRTPETNYHVVDAGQRFAYDFVIVRDGSSHAGNAGRVEDYHCWDEPIRAPAAGRVVAAVDGLDDNAIGATEVARPAGNHVVIDLGHGEFAFLAHLRRDSVAVERGQSVAAGDEVGRCGNSGNSSEPHLHFHLQNAPVLGKGEGLPAFFEDYVADGTVTRRGEPRRGQVVEANAR